MADNTVTASGPTRGASYVLPWDTMAQYDQMVTATKDKFEAQNQQRLATIADMEKQDLTGMPSYDKALEDHYEQLHGQIGKIITKYRDPFQSLEGMRELKDVQAKYIANPIVNNAKETEGAFKRMQLDYAENRITPEDYAIKKAEYDKHITEGDVSKPFEYGRPDYLQSSKIFDDVFKDMDKSVLKQSPNGSTIGYSDPQFDQAVNLAMIGQHGAALVREIDQNLTQQGITINEQSRQAEGVRLAKLYKPLDVNKIYHQASDSEDSKNMVLPSDLILNTGKIPRQMVGGFIETNAKTKSIELSTLGRGQGNDAYSFDPDGAATFFESADDADLSRSHFVNSRVLMPRQNIATSFTKKLLNAANSLRSKGIAIDNLNLLSTVNQGTEIKDSNDKTVKLPVKQMLKPQFDALAGELGIPQKDGSWDYIANEFNQGQYALTGKFVTYDEGKLVDKGSENTGYSGNAILFHLLNHGISAPKEEASIPGEMKSAMSEYFGLKSGTDMVVVDGVQLPLRLDNTKLADSDVSQNITPKPTGIRNMQRSMTGVGSYENNFGGKAVLRSATGGWAGIGDVSNRIPKNNLGIENLGEILTDKNSVMALISGYNDAANATKVRGDQVYGTQLERLIRTNDVSYLEDLFSAGGDASFNATANPVLAKAGYDMKTKTYDQNKYDLLNPVEKGIFNMKKDLLKLQGKEIVSNKKK